MMKSFDTEWRDLQLPSGQSFSIAICGYCNKVRYMTFGADPLKQIFNQETYFNEDGTCDSGHLCIAKDCRFNTTTDEKMAELFGVDVDDEVDEATAKQWGSNTMAGCYVAMAKRISDELAEEKKNEA